MSMEHFNFLLSEFEPPPPESGNEIGNLALKAEDEIKRFTIDEDISDVDRTVTYLTGHPMQQRVAIEHLPQVIKNHGRIAFDAISTPLKKAMGSLDTEGHVAIANMLAAVCQQRYLSGKDQGECILPMVLKHLRSKEKEQPEPELHDAWLGCLQAMAPNLEASVLGQELSEIVAKKSEVTQSTYARVTSCVILGAIAPGLKREAVSAQFFKRAMEMCQDTDYPVRIAMAEQLTVLASVMGQEETQKTILPEVFELLNDEEPQVCTVGMECFGQLIDLLPPEVQKEAVAPNFLELCMSHQLKRAPGLSAWIGPMIVKLSQFLHSSTELETCIASFCWMSLQGQEDTRRNCARNFPAILKVAGDKRYSTFLHNVFVSLAADKDEEVRVAIAAQFHEVSKVLGRDRCVKFLKLPLCRLLKDSSVTVQEKLCKHLDSTLRSFAGTPEQMKHCQLTGDDFFMEIMPTILAFEHGMDKNWRLRASFLTAMAGFPHYFTSEQLYECFLPIVLAGLGTGFPAVRAAAADTIAAFLRHNRRPAQKVELYGTLIREYCRGKSCYNRLIFLEFCHSALKRFSAAFVRLHFMDPCLELQWDRIPTVRAEFCMLLPKLKAIIQLPEDVEKLERINTAMKNLSNDNDRYVAEVARSIQDQMKRTNVRMMGVDATISMNGTAISDTQEWEKLDRAREAEEAEIGFPKEDMERIKLEDGTPSPKGKADGKTKGLFQQGPNTPTLPPSHSIGRRRIATASTSRSMDSKPTPLARTLARRASTDATVLSSGSGAAVSPPASHRRSSPSPGTSRIAKLSTGIQAASHLPLQKKSIGQSETNSGTGRLGGAGRGTKTKVEPGKGSLSPVPRTGSTSTLTPGAKAGAATPAVVQQDPPPLGGPANDMLAGSLSPLSMTSTGPDSYNGVQLQGSIDVLHRLGNDSQLQSRV
eukprot:CAMPEP_0117687278 /NCGR_PEP_ID=MMETSP0804-20121206/23033_1 /TAXON_ID=1074897 /ORGANISM="Tetraselmis astigmatica, Strain CCMP880" /LENGTH=928 /DNA_ID=CAMNT_0005499297 /DNA_START=369 /DNA_END=3157 /DNA_ORIENTATION=+